MLIRILLAASLTIVCLSSECCETVELTTATYHEANVQKTELFHEYKLDNRQSSVAVTQSTLHTIGIVFKKDVDTTNIAQIVIKKQLNNEAPVNLDQDDNLNIERSENAINIFYQPRNVIYSFNLSFDESHVPKQGLEYEVVAVPRDVSVRPLQFELSEAKKILAKETFKGTYKHTGDYFQTYQIRVQQDTILKVGTRKCLGDVQLKLQSSLGNPSEHTISPTMPFTLDTTNSRHNMSFFANQCKIFL